MNNGKIAIFGASGLVGSRLCESLYLNKRYDFRALIHSAGNAFRIAKYPMEIEQVDLLDRKQINRSLRDCSVIVNCSRGDNCVMIQGLKNLIKEAAKRNIKKVIHLSSVLIYGAAPAPESSTEACKPDPQGNDYGEIKLKQDNLLLRKKDLFQLIILCPPNIYGPYSQFILSALHNAAEGNIALVDAGRNPCNLIHVDNLVLAVYNALENDSATGQRFFVKDRGEPTWRDFWLRFLSTMGLESHLPNLASCLLEKHEDIVRKNGTLKSLSGSVKSVVSPEVRNALSHLPIFSTVLNYISYRFNCLNPQLQDKLRAKLSSPIVVPKEPEFNDLNYPLISVQTRKVSHSIDKARNMLDYNPLYDLNKGLENTKVWMLSHNLI